MEPDVFLVEVWIKPTNNVKVYLDADNGISIERLVQFNRRLYKEFEEEQVFPNNDFSLEISSPGLDEPLKLNRQYKKNIGRYVEVVQADGARAEGKLISAEDDRVIVEEEKGKGKKKHKGLPPGLAKKVERGGHLPPGWEKKVSVGETMPVEVIKECKPLPKELIIKLPPPPIGTITLTVNGKIVRLLEASKTILDVFEVPLPPFSKR